MNQQEYIEKLRKLEKECFDNDMPETGTKLAQERLFIEAKLLLKEGKEVKV